MIDERLTKKSFVCSYSRKSEEDESKQVQSIPAQKKVNGQMAERYGTLILKKNEFSEERSAKEPGRPVFNELIGKIEQHEHTTLFCWNLNRLTRNPIDAGTIEWLRQRGKLTVITPHQIFDQNTNAIVSGVEASQGNQQIIELSRNVKRGNQAKRDKGVPGGVAPPGYRNAGTQKGEKWFEPDDGNPNRFLLIQKAFRLVLDGMSPMDTLRILNDEWGFRTIKRKKLGGGPVSASTWYTMLRNPLYCGKFICLHGMSDEKWYEVKEPRFRPMFSEEEYWKLQDVLGENGRPRPKLLDEERGAFLKLLTCGGCGSTMTHDRKRHVRCLCKHKYSAFHRDICPRCGTHESKVPKERKHFYDYWFCPRRDHGCSQPVVRTDDLEKEIVAKLDSITIPQEFIDWALEWLDEQNDDELTSQEATLQSLQNTYESKQQELNRLHRAYMKGAYDYEGGDEEHGKTMRKLIAEKNALKKRLDEFDVRADDWRERTERGYLFCKEAKAAFADGDHRTKREILSTLCEKAVVNGKTLDLSIEPPFVFIRKKLSEIRAKFPATEPEKIAEMARDEANKFFVDAVKLTWLRGMDSNHD